MNEQAGQDRGVEVRIAELERRVRRLWGALALCGLGAAAACTAAAVAPREREVRAERFVVVDAQGREWGSFGLLELNPLAYSGGVGVGLSMVGGDSEQHSDGPQAEIGLMVLPKCEEPGAVASPWFALLVMESDASPHDDRESSINMLVAHDGAAVNARCSETRGAYLAATAQSVHLVLEEDDLEQDDDDDEELGALELSLEGGLPAIEGRAREESQRFRLPR